MWKTFSTTEKKEFVEKEEEEEEEIYWSDEEEDDLETNNTFNDYSILVEKLWEEYKKGERKLKWEREER